VCRQEERGGGDRALLLYGVICLSLAGRQLQSNYRGGGGGLQQQVRAFTNYGTPGQAATGTYSMVGTPAMAGSGSVLMLYGLAHGRINCDHIFNLLCSYGNVLKVMVWCRPLLSLCVHML